MVQFAGGGVCHGGGRHAQHAQHDSTAPRRLASPFTDHDENFLVYAIDLQAFSHTQVAVTPVSKLGSPDYPVNRLYKEIQIVDQGDFKVQQGKEGSSFALSPKKRSGLLRMRNQLH